MIKKTFAVLLTMLALVFVVTACNTGGVTPEPEAPKDTPEDEKKADEAKPEAEEDPAEQEEKDSVQEEGSGANDEDPETSTETNAFLSEKMEVNEQISHVNGTVLKLESISFDDEFITVNFTAINGSIGTIGLAWDGRQGVILEDDTGHTYPFLPPEDNETLEIEEGERLSGSLIFIGKLREDATSLHLIFNPEGHKDDTSTSSPYFSFESIDLQR